MLKRVLLCALLMANFGTVFAPRTQGSNQARKAKNGKADDGEEVMAQAEMMRRQQIEKASDQRLSSSISEAGSPERLPDSPTPTETGARPGSPAKSVGTGSNTSTVAAIRRTTSTPYRQGNAASNTTAEMLQKGKNYGNLATQRSKNQAENIANTQRNLGFEAITTEWSDQERAAVNAALAKEGTTQYSYQFEDLQRIFNALPHGNALRTEIAKLMNELRSSGGIGLRPRTLSPSSPSRNASNSGDDDATSTASLDDISFGGLGSSRDYGDFNSESDSLRYLSDSGRSDSSALPTNDSMLELLTAIRQRKPADNPFAPSLSRTSSDDSMASTEEWRNAEEQKAALSALLKQAEEEPQITPQGRQSSSFDIDTITGSSIFNRNKISDDGHTVQD